MTEKNRFRICPRPFRLAGYVLWLALMLLFFLMFRSYVLLFFTAFLMIIPLFSLVTGAFLVRRVSAFIRVYHADISRPGDEVFPVIELTNHLVIGTLDVRVHLTVRNITWSKTEDDLMVSLPLVARWLHDGVSTLRIPFTTTRIGCYRMEIIGVEVQDPIGLVRYRIGSAGVRPSGEAGFSSAERFVRSGEAGRDVSSQEKKTTGITSIPAGWISKAEFVTLPPVGIGHAPDAESVSSGMTEVEESNRRGSDFSEVSDIREYTPGDRLRDIHWKLSARQEEWMVKIRTQMAGLELTVVVAPEEELNTGRTVDTQEVKKTSRGFMKRESDMSYVEEPPGLPERILMYTYQELRVWTEGETDIRLLAYSATSGGFDSFTLANPADVDRAFEEILSMPVSARIPSGTGPAGLDAILNNLYPFLGGYIRFGRMENGYVGWIPVEGNRG